MTELDFVSPYLIIIAVITTTKGRYVKERETRHMYSTLVILNLLPFTLRMLL
jgi:hypothetical protein